MSRLFLSRNIEWRRPGPGSLHCGGGGNHSEAALRGASLCVRHHTGRFGGHALHCLSPLPTVRCSCAANSHCRQGTASDRCPCHVRGAAGWVADKWLGFLCDWHGRYFDAVSITAVSAAGTDNARPERTCTVTVSNESDEMSCGDRGTGWVVCGQLSTHSAVDTHRTSMCRRTCQRLPVASGPCLQMVALRSLRWDPTLPCTASSL